MNVNETLEKNGSFVLPGAAQQQSFLCARCRSSNVTLVLREATAQEEHQLYIRLECSNCGNYIETGLVPNDNT